jgi:outer membrane protein assembly factor BamE (lipoprotein component of BamABCDE complex)
MKKQTLIVIFLALAACSPKVDERGYVKQGDAAGRLVVGQTSKQEVFDALGSPSSQSSFGPETWYYIHNRKETIGFLAPESADQDVMRIEFDASGIVAKMENYGQDKAQEVQNVKRVTPTEGHSVSFIEQTLGNVGRFNRPGDNSGTVAPGRKPSSGGY